MLKIRLKRTGRRGDPHYKIVVMQDNQPRDGRAIAEIGYYNPRNHPTTFDINKEEAAKWLKNGAQPTDTIAQYFVKLGLMKDLKRGSHKPNTEKKTKEEK